VITSILDTETLPPEQRAKIWTEFFFEAVAPMSVRFEQPDHLVGRMESWQLGDIGALRTVTNTGKTMQLTTAQARSREQPLFSIGLQLASIGRFDQFGAQSEVRPGELHCVDISEPFEFGWAGRGSSVAMVALSTDELGLPVDTVRKGATRIRSSALFSLTSNHVRQVMTPEMSVDAGAAALGAATLDLCRALLVSAAQDARRERDVMVETLLTRVQTYVRQHLRDVDLSPARIAAAHNISLRYLYKMCSAAGYSLEQSVISRRLALARRDLASPESAPLTIATIAFRCGFRDQSHFSRRFRDEFGMSPRDWRALSLRTAVPAGTPVSGGA
jgi:AraC-like DNA-binding protein